MNPVATPPAATPSAEPPPAPGREARRARRSRWTAPAAGVLLAALTLTGCAGTAVGDAPVPPPPPPTADLTAEDLDTWLDGLVPAALEQTGIPGAAISVVHDGEVLTARGYGHADTGADGGDPVPVDADRTLFRVGSVSKLFTATAVMQLVERGEIDLDADVHEYLDFTVPTSFDDDLTTRHLLTHTPGFEERIADLIAPEDTEIDLRGHLVTDPPEQVYRPGTIPAYSNYGATLAGYVVERVSGVPFEEYVRENILEPLGMDSSDFAQPLPGDLRDRMAGGYASATGPAGPFEVVTAAPAGALTSSATDMARFMLAHLGETGDGPTLLAPETLELMHAPGLDADSLGALAEGPRMTLGFFEENRNGRHIVGHGGDTKFFHTHLQLHPEAGTGVFVTLNGGGRGDIDSLRLRESILHGFTDRYFPGDPGSQGTRPTAAEHAAVAEGVYESSRSMHTTFLSVLGALGGQTHIVAREDGTILVTPGPETLEPTVYEEIEPWVWREVGGQRMLTMRVRDDRVEAIGYASAFALLPASPARHASLTLPILALSTLILLAAALARPVGALIRRRFSLPAPTRTARLPRALRTTGAVAVLAALAGWALTLTRVMELEQVSPLLLRALVAVQWLGVLAVIPAALVLVGDARHRAGAWRYVTGALVLLGLVGVAYFAAVFGLLSLDVSY
ncbi:serine hydrolase [Streptomyces sp. ST2-7A]|uniref:serine hydrolase domain-containing protein n=1 Tax=Streptomyces sp. ST2-7A TaxID=2907214 RepID=UPI001F396FB0|nr:serine hydrolase domain-containing protein [Streptomyces sp. ST2-7A]MCE7082075.1 beta-lactamase family protein [Streptomyces sp. ST2-7A]